MYVDKDNILKYKSSFSLILSFLQESLPTQAINIFVLIFEEYFHLDF